MSFWRKYGWVSLISARSNLAYLNEAASRVFFLGIILFVFLRLWQVAYNETGSTSLAGLTLSEMLWYLMIAESIILSGPRVAQIVDEDVRTGALAVQLVRPICYPLYQLSVTLGERLVRFLVTAAAGTVVAIVLVGPIHLSAAGLICFALSLPLSFTLDFLGNFLIGLGAFWLEDTSGLLLIYSRLTMILGGMLLPLDLFPDAVKPLLQALPFASIIYGPARMFVHPSVSTLSELVLKQGIAIAGFTVAIVLVYTKALKRIHAHGG